jgi:hypothetical protein
MTRLPGDPGREVSAFTHAFVSDAASSLHGATQGGADSRGERPAPTVICLVHRCRPLWYNSAAFGEFDSGTTAVLATER